MSHGQKSRAGIFARNALAKRLLTSSPSVQNPRNELDRVRYFKNRRVDRSVHAFSRGTIASNLQGVLFIHGGRLCVAHISRSLLWQAR